MQVQPDLNVLLTGATGGLGTYMTRAFAEKGVGLALVAYPGTGLDSLSREVKARGGRAIAFSLDLREPALRHQLVTEVTDKLGAVDILVNNAGIEFTAAYHELSEERIRDVLNLNLEAPMTLTRLLLPGMLARNRGHIVSISSLAGKSGPAFQEPYAATKAALIAFTSSLRATYYHTGVSASVITPGFVEAGIYAKLKARSGLSAPSILGTSLPTKVATAVIRAVEHNLPEIIINPIPVRPLLAVAALLPRVGEWLTHKTGVNDFFRKVVEMQDQSDR
jgi:short-subunit dehydrogenase